MGKDPLDLELPVGKRTKFYRLFEMLPGIASYTVILLPFVLSVISPTFGAIFVIIYIVIWFVKSIGMSIRSVQGLSIVEKAQKIAWRRRLEDLEDPKAALRKKVKGDTWKRHVHIHNLERLMLTEGAKKPSSIYNAVIIATYNESRAVLEPTLQSLLASDYDMQHMIVVLAYEQRGGEAIKRTVFDLQKVYGDKFGKFFVVEHPQGIADEVVGKGGNITYAGKFLQAETNKLGIDPENIIVTTLDSDNRPHTQYFAYLTYEYVVHPDPRYTSFQPPALFLNNIWDVPAPMRVLAANNSFWNVVISQRPNMLRNFASHSQSLAALIDMDFWSTRTIVEDGHQFWRSYFRYDGHYDVTPVYVPIYQDAVLGATYRSTLKAQFLQLRRWAYGASDVPYVAERVLTKKRTVPFWDGLLKLARLLEGHISWASASFIFIFGAFAPLFLNADSNRSIAAHQLPSVASSIQQVATVGLIIMIILSFRMLPKRPKAYSWWKNVLMILQWVLAPILALIYGSIAALNAQTHLLLGKYLDKFDVTEKAVVNHDNQK